jgi:hypothetical protein
VDPRPIPGDNSSTPPSHSNVHSTYLHQVSRFVNPAPKLHSAEPVALCRPDSQIIQVPSPEPNVTTDEAQAANCLGRTMGQQAGQRNLSRLKRFQIERRKRNQTVHIPAKYRYPGARPCGATDAALVRRVDSARDGHQNAIPEDQTLIHQTGCQAWRAAPFPAKEGLKALTSWREDGGAA